MCTRFSLGELIPDPYIGEVEVTRMSGNTVPVNAENETEMRDDTHREAQDDPLREKIIAQILANHPTLTRDEVLAEMEAYGF
jgi:hypothetical protein